MNWSRAFFYLLYRKRKYRKLLVPFVFLRIELFITAFLIFRILGIASPVFENKEKPLVLVSYLHSEKLVSPYGKFSEEKIDLVKVSREKRKKVLIFIINVIIGFLGITVSSLWIDRFFRKNNLNPRWWFWQFGCLGGHLICFIITLF